MRSGRGEGFGADEGTGPRVAWRSVPGLLRPQRCSRAVGSGWAGAAPAWYLRCWQLSPPLPPPVSEPPLPSPAQTTEAFQRKLLLILAVIPGHPHPQLPLPLWAPEMAPGHSSESQPKALMGEGPILPCSKPSPVSTLENTGSSPALVLSYWTTSQSLHLPSPGSPLGLWDLLLGRP